MTPILQILQNIIPVQDKIRAKLPRMARFGVIALLIVIAFIIFVFQAEFLMRYMIALLPIFYIVAVLSVGAKRALYGTAVFIFFCFALWVRVGPEYNTILGGPVIQFQDDASYHLRLIENMVQHFPQRISFDVYTTYPTGQQVPFAPFFDFLIGLFIWIAGLGHPSAILIEKMVAYYPAVLGAMVVIPVYFIGKELFNNRNAGLLAAALIAISAGEFFSRSTLGYADHHIAETLFSTIAMMFLIMAVKRAQESQPTFSNVKNKEWSHLKKPLIYSALAGLMLGLYLLTWIGGALFIGIILIYFGIQYVVDHLRSKSTDYLFVIGIPVLFIGLILTAPFSNILTFSNITIVLLVIGLIAIFGMSGLSRLMTRFNVKRLLYPITLIILAGLGALIFYFADKSLFNTVSNQFQVFTPAGVGLTVQEMQPLLGGFSMSSLTSHRVWWYFTTGVFLAPLAFLAVVYSAANGQKLSKLLFLCWIVIAILTIIIDQFFHVPWQLYMAEGLAIVAIYCYFEKNSAKIVFIIWCTVIMLAALGQTRFAYYPAVNMALLICYVLWKLPAVIQKIFQFIGWKEALAQDRSTKASKKNRGKELEEQRALSHFKPQYLSVFLSLIAIFFLTVYPNLLYGLASSKAWDPSNSAVIYRARNPITTPSDWIDSMVWMKNNTPEPFGNDSFYYSLYDKPSDGQPYAYPDTAYGVMSWWDYGHWITLFAHRIPNANPFQSGIGGPGPNGTTIPGASTFMTAQDEANGSAILYKLGSRYVVLDFKTAGIYPQNSIFSVMPIWAGQNPKNYSEVWYQQTSDGKISGFFVFYPMYYKSMCVRLYSFDAEEVVPNNSTWALSYTEVTDKSSGQKFKLLKDAANNGSAFATYEDAVKFVQDHPGYTIVGVTPRQSPIPLDALNEYKLIHSSATNVAQPGEKAISWVKIFEYTSSK